MSFPEGTAIGHVLQIGATSISGFKQLIQGTSFSGLIAFCQSGLFVISDNLSFWWGKITGPVFSMGIGFLPALIAAGYIVGINVGITLLVGAVISAVAIPILSS